MGQPFKPFQHQEKPNDEVVDLLEDHRVGLAIALEILLKMAGHLGPMHRWVNVVGNMVAVVEAAPVVKRVDAGQAVPIRILGMGPFHEGMLGPIAVHHHQAGE